MVLAPVVMSRLSEHVYRAGALPGEEEMVTASFSRFSMLPPAGSKCGNGQGSDRACVVLDYSLSSEQ